jgi:hypothetical protein
MSEMLHPLGSVNGYANGHGKLEAEQPVPLPCACPPWLPELLWAIIEDDTEQTMTRIEAGKLLALLNRWYEPGVDDFPIANELIARINQRRAEYEVAFALERSQITPQKPRMPVLCARKGS